MKRLEDLVADFARNVEAATDATWQGDAKTGNKHAKRYIAIFEELRTYGDAGRDALAALFADSRIDVRVSAAAFLLRHRTAEAKAVLKEAASSEGWSAFVALQALKRWEEGNWSLDPADM